MQKRPAAKKPAALDRRTLFAYGAATAAIAAARPVFCSQRGATPEAAPPAKADSFELDEVTIADLQKKMVSGEETARSLTEKYIARIEALDKRGPALRSVL